MGNASGSAKPCVPSAETGVQTITSPDPGPLSKWELEGAWFERGFYGVTSVTGRTLASFIVNATEIDAIPPLSGHSDGGGCHRLSLEELS